MEKGNRAEVYSELVDQCRLDGRVPVGDRPSRVAGYFRNNSHPLGFSSRIVEETEPADDGLLLPLKGARD